MGLGGTRAVCTAKGNAMKIQLILLMALFLAGCATTPTPLSQALPTPEDRIYYRAPEGKPTATVVFIRDGGFVASGVYQHLTINEERAAAIDVGEKATLRLPAGEYVFAVTPTDPFGTWAPYAIDQRLEAGKTYHYRILTDGNNMDTRLHRVLGKSVE